LLVVHLLFIAIYDRLQMRQLLQDLLLNRHVSHGEIGETKDGLEEACLDPWTIKVDLLHQRTIDRVFENGLA